MQNLKICCVGRFTFPLRRQCTTLHSYYWHKTWWCLWNVQFSSMNSPDFFVKCQVDFSSRLFNSLSLKFSRIFYMANETNFFLLSVKESPFWMAPQLTKNSSFFSFHFISIHSICFCFEMSRLNPPLNPSLSHTFHPHIWRHPRQVTNSPAEENNKEKGCVK